jgi:hypothetical protein
MGLGWFRFKDKFLGKINLEEFNKALVTRSQKQRHDDAAFSFCNLNILCVTLVASN